MATIRVANAPCSWGSLEFELAGQAAGYGQVLDEIQASGYAGTELGDWGFMPTAPSVLKDELAKRDLKLLGAFVPVAFLRDEALPAGISAATRVARLLKEAGDSPYLVLADDNGSIEERTQNAGRVQPGMGLSDSQWKRYAANVERVASAVREAAGLKALFHHHCAGYVETPEETRRLMELTDPDVLGLVFDTGHFTFGGGDALAFMRECKDRIPYAHFKDCSAEIARQSREEQWDYFTSVKNGVFCELGKGAVDFPAIIEELKSWNYDGWAVVEQDVLPGMGTPLESAKNNRAYLKSLGV